MLLYEHPLSSYAQKVKIALREKVPAGRKLIDVEGVGFEERAQRIAHRVVIVENANPARHACPDHRR